MNTDKLWHRVDTIKRHLHFSGQEGLQQLKKIAELIEGKSYNAAASQSDYWHEISSKMLTLNSKSQNSVPNSSTSNSVCTGDKPPDAEVLTAAPSKLLQEQSLLVPPDNQLQAEQQVLSENMETTITSNGGQTPTSLPTSLPPASGTNQTPNNVTSQNANNMPIVTPNTVGGTLTAQGVPSNMFGNAQLQLIELQKQLLQLQQQLLIQLQGQQQLQPQQSVMNTTQLHPATQSGMQKSSVSMIGAPISSLPQNRLSSVRQSIIMEQLQQQQTNHQNTLGHLLMVQQNNRSGIHQQQMVPQSNFPGLQQQIPQHQLLGTQYGNSSMQSNLSSNHQQQLVPQSLQQQMLQQGTQTGNSGMQSNLSGKDQQQPIPLSGLRQLMSKQPRLGTMSGISSMQSNLSASLDSTAQTGHANGGGWQEEVYQKIQTMKEMYLPELNEMYKQYDAKLQQHCDSPVLKAKLERMISFLQVSKDSLLLSYKDCLDSYEEEMATLLNLYRPSKRMRQLPSPDVQKMSPLYQIDDAKEMKPDISSLPNADDVVSSVEQAW
ncbi:unnamed protein product [Linum tenue]|uniref:Mediator complex subunit 15 KIX domain-containing protein n=1 Tax=Linum tenue TaxID=586396 RepID=A0AAV0NLD8_9ROSI|nr:unnamed protein product [Linum tenue]